MPDKIVPLIKAKKTPRKDVFLDPEGFFVIILHKEEIRVEYYSNVYKNGKIDSELFLPEKDWWDVPNLFRGLKEHGIQIKFSNPPK